MCSTNIYSVTVSSKVQGIESCNFFLRSQIKLHLFVEHETVWHVESKQRFINLASLKHHNRINIIAVKM